MVVCMKRQRLKILTWNMGGFAYRNKQAEAWRHLAGVLKPDIALLQEVPCAPPRLSPENGSVLAYHGKKYGTAIFAAPDFVETVSPHEMAAFCSSRLYISAVDVLGFADPLVLMSVHVYPGNAQKGHLRMLTEVLEQARRSKPVIVGGDFNACRHYDLVYKRNAYRWFFEEMERIGFVDCHYRLHHREKQSYWSKRTKEPYQDDHFFAPEDWASRIVSCDVLSYDPVSGISDHSPVELVMNLPKLTGSNAA